MKAKRISIIVVLVVLAVESTGYFLLSDGPYDREVLKYVSERSVSSTGSVCILAAAYTNLGKKAQASLLGILSNQYATVYVGVDSVPEEDRLYIRPYTNAADFAAALKRDVLRETIKAEMSHRPLLLHLDQIRGGERFYWFSYRKGFWRKTLVFFHDNKWVNRDYFWLMGHWQSYRSPWAVCFDRGGIIVAKTLPEWKRMSPQELDEASGLQPLTDEN